MKTAFRTIRVSIPAWALLACVLQPCQAQAFYNPSTGRWLSRDPVEERRQALYVIARNDCVGKVDFRGLLTKSLTTDDNGTIDVSTTGEKIDRFLDYQRNIKSFLTWTPPSKGNWGSWCDCKPCQRAEWRQQIAWGLAAGWTDDNYDPSHGVAVIQWDCNTPFETGFDDSPDSARSEDHPGVSSWIGPWMFVLSDYWLYVRTKIQCVAGKEAGKVYYHVSWGGSYRYDNTPVPREIIIGTGDWSQ